MSSLLWALEGNIRDIGALLTFLQELYGWQDNVFHFTVNKLGLGCYTFGRDEWLRQEEQPYSTNCLCTLPKHSAPLPVPEMYSLSCRCVGESVVWGLFRAIYPGMPNIFKKKRLVFGWVFFPSLCWESFCFNSDEPQRGAWDRVPGFWLLCLAGFDCPGTHNHHLCCWSQASSGGAETPLQYLKLLSAVGWLFCGAGHEALVL